MPFKKYLTIILLTVVSTGFSQSIHSKADDAFTELETEELILHFTNSQNGNPISNAYIEIQNIGSFETDFKGSTLFPIPEEDGKYVVTFSKEGYITSTFNIEIMVGSLFFNRFSMSPYIPLGTVRIVLDWDKKPRDLDAHFVKKGAYHISYRNMSVSNDSVCTLDRDDINSYGPETISAAWIDKQGEYLYYVHDYSNRSKDSSKKLSKSKATIKVYNGRNGLIHIFEVPRQGKGVYWQVFKIENEQIIPLVKDITTSIRF